MSYTPFELIVFNVEQGDCLLLKLPDNKYGLIDFHCDEFINGKDHLNRVIPPSLTYLKQQKAKGEDVSIAFLHFSHYHSDHIKGISLLEVFLRENHISMDELELWLPLGFDILDIESRIDKPKYRSIKAKLNAKYPNVYNDFSFSMKTIRNIWKTRAENKRKKITGIKNQYRIDELNIYSLAPNAEHAIEHGKDIIIEFLDRYLIPKSIDDKNTSINTADRNLLSSILKISNGQIRVILGGDACKVTWEKVLEEIPEHKTDAKYSLPMHYESRLIKVSHHGASNASFVAKWERILESYPELHFVFSAGLHGKYKHPHDKTIEQIESVSLQKNAKAIHYSTNSYKDSKIAKAIPIKDWPMIAQDLKLKERVQNKMIKNLEEDSMGKSITPQRNLAKGTYYDGTHRISDPNLIGFRFKIGENIVAERMEIC